MTGEFGSDHLLVVGGGIIGLSIAWRLAREGRQVTVIESGTLGKGTSRSAGGMLGLTAEVKFGEEELLELQRQSLSSYPRFVEELLQDSGVDVHYRTEGTLVVARDRDDMEALERVFVYQQKAGLDATWISDQRLRREEPHLRRLHGAVHCPNDHQVDPLRLIKALRKSCLNRGVQIVENAKVKSILVDDKDALGVGLEDGREIFAPKTIVAAGVWSTKIEGIPELSEPYSIRPIRGQMIALKYGPIPLIKHVVRSPDVYIIPRYDGMLLIGSTMEERGFDSSLTAGGVRTLLDEAWRILPGIDELNIHATWTGFRPVSLDDRPLIGPSSLSDLILACGHGRHGVLLAPVTAQRVVDLILAGAEQESSESLFDPRRFVSNPL